MTSVRRKAKLIFKVILGRSRGKILPFILFVLSTIFVSIIWIRNNIIALDYLYKLKETLHYDDISCYNYKDHNNDSANAISFPLKSIFFIKTSCKRFKFYEACAIESASKTHANKQINVLFISPTPRCDCQNKFLDKILGLTNVEFSRVYLSNYIAKTPIDEQLIRNILKRRRRHIILQEILKLLVLYKHGGIFMDINVVLAKSLYRLSTNFAVREDTQISTAIMAVHRYSRKNFIGPVLSLLNNQTDIDERSISKTLTEEFTKLCLVNSTINDTSRILNNDLDSFISCKPFKVFHPQYFHPIRREHWYEYYQDMKLKNTAVAYHLYASEHRERIIPNNSLYARVAENYCPLSYKLHLRDW